MFVESRGEVTAPHLVQMDVNELADASIVAERAAAEKKLADEVALDYSRRADVVAAKRKVGLVPFMLLSAGGRGQNLNNWEKQTRAADEPMTQFFQCLDCDNKWRF